MKNKVFSMVMAVLLVVGFLLAACDDDTEEDVVKSIKIENIDTAILNAGIGILAEMPQNFANDTLSLTAVRYGIISNNTLTVELTIPNNNTVENPQNLWKGKGEYFVLFIPIINSTINRSNILVYAGGGDSPVKVNIVDSVTTLDFGKFKDAIEN